MTNLHLRILAGILLSLVWVTANLACANNTAPSTLPRSGLPPSAAEPSLPAPTITFATVPPTTQPIVLPTPKQASAEHPTVPTITPPLPTSGSSVPSHTEPPSHFFEPAVKEVYANSMTGQQYRYFERSQDVIALQVELGMRSVDGIYGPDTRKAHVDALGGPTAVLYRNYPEIGQTPIPCSLAHEPEKTTCGPGDGHYELPTLGALINEYFEPEDRALARMIAFCESSGQTHDIGSEEVSSALAIGWFQHLAKYWQERSEKAGFTDYDPFNGRANVGVAAWLYYTSGVHHWNPSRTCWGQPSL